MRAKRPLRDELHVTLGGRSLGAIQVITTDRTHTYGLRKLLMTMDPRQSRVPTCCEPDEELSCPDAISAILF